MNHKSNYQGLRAILLARCSTNIQIEDSIPQQLELLRKFAAENKMIVIDTETSEGVSGSKPGERSDLKKLLERAQNGEFDALVFQSYDRFTRRGAEAGIEIIQQFKKCGVRCISVIDDIPADSEFGWLLQGMRLHEGKSYAKSLAYATSRGQMAHMLEGKIAYTHNVPYGFDRLYSNADKTPLHVIRNLPDGRQEKLHHETRQHLMFFQRNENKKVNHYQKQTNERVMLIPGSEEAVGAVRQMFRRKFIDGWGFSRIAKELNNTGVTSRTGILWNNVVVGNILKNPIYVGKGITTRVSCGFIVKRDKDGPIKLTEERTLPLKKKKQKPGEEPEYRVTLPPVYRPESEWTIIEYDYLKGYLGLDPDVLESIWNWQLERLREKSEGVHLKAQKDKHTNSSFFLKGIIRSRQGDRAMSGRSSLRHGERSRNRNRYYYVTRAHQVPHDGCQLSGGVEANGVEQAVLDVIADVCRSPGFAVADIQKIVEEKVAETETARASLAALESQKAGVVKKLLRLLDYDEDTQNEPEVVAQREELQARRKTLDAQIRKVQDTEDVGHPDVEAIAVSVREQLTQIGETIRERPTDSIRTVVEVLIPKIVADVKTKEVEMELALPYWALSAENKLSKAVCLDQGIHLHSLVEANTPALPLGAFHCVQIKPSRGKTGCLACSRVSDRPMKLHVPPLQATEPAKLAG